MTTKLSRRAAAVVCALLLAGCGGGGSGGTPSPSTTAPTAVGSPKEKDAVTKQRDKLSAEDRALVEAQEWCVISNEEHLGGMGVPVKLDIKGQPVFICCKGCKAAAERDPDKTLAKLAELKAKKAAGK